MESFYTVDKFNRGYRGGGGSGVGNLDEKIKEAEDNFSKLAKPIFLKLKQDIDDANKKLDDRITAIEKLGEHYSVTSTYFSTHKRRIVNVAKGKDSNDVITKGQLDEAVGRLEKQINDLKTKP